MYLTLYLSVSVHQVPKTKAHTLIQNPYINMHLAYKTPYYIQKFPRLLFRLVFLPFSSLLQVCCSLSRASDGNNASCQGLRTPFSQQSSLLQLGAAMFFNTPKSVPESSSAQNLMGWVLKARVDGVSPI